MKLQSLVKKYVDFKKGLGYGFETNERMILSFVRKIGPNIELEKIKLQQVSNFLKGQGTLTRTWHVKYNALKGLFRYAIRMKYLSKMPLPSVVPKQPPTIIPYIYTHDEIKKILEATSTFQKNISSIEPITVRTIILLLYGAGLRAHEAISLAMDDVDLKNSLLIIRQAKCNKSRLVPIGNQLTKELSSYSKYRSKVCRNLDKNAPFFILRNGKKVNLGTIRGIFQRLRKHAGIHRTDGARYQPRLHDLRHSFAVHRLITWYQQGEDVIKLLHQLSVYLGHVHLVDTQVYLTMTPQLLNEANTRFQKYVLGGHGNEKN